MNTLIMKFGGNAVGTVTALTQVLSIILHEEKRWDKLIVVVSALDGVTDMLLEAAHLAQLSNQRGYRRIAATLRTRHLALIDQLPLGQNERHALSADIDHLLFEMLDVCQSVANTPTEHLSAQISDRIIQVGERLSARIVAALLRQNHLRGVAMDGTDIIVTDDIFGNATPQLEPTQQRIETHLTPLLERQIIPVVTGFIGGTADGQVTTMGRGGSDYTASVLSICTQAKEVWLWSDVDGMMSTDPREVDNARVIETLTYQEVAEMAHFGARILHPRMIQPLAKAQIPLRIKNIYKPQLAGTRIAEHRQDGLLQDSRIKAVTMSQGIHVTGAQHGSLAKLISVIDDTFFTITGSRIDMMFTQQSSEASSLVFVVPTNAGIEAIDRLCGQIEEAIIGLPHATVWDVNAVQILTLVGNGIGQNPSLLATTLQLVNDLPIISIKHGISVDSISLVVPDELGDEALHRLHRYITQQSQ